MSQKYLRRNEKGNFLIHKLIIEIVIQSENKLTSKIVSRNSQAWNLAVEQRPNFKDVRKTLENLQGQINRGQDSPTS